MELKIYFLFLILFISFTYTKGDEKSIPDIISLDEITTYDIKEKKFYAFYLNITKEKSEEDIIIYTNKDVNMKVVEIEKNETQFTIDKSIITHGKIYNNQNLFYINIPEALSKNIVGYYFSIPEINVEFSIYKIFLNFENNRTIRQNFYKKREENFNFHSNFISFPYFEFYKPYCLINHYERYEEKYLLFIEKLYEPLNIIIEVLNLKKNEIISLDATNPAILKGQYDIICYYYEMPQNEEENIEGKEYSFNEFNIKCNNHNNEKLNEGDFIQIYLEPGEETNLNLPNSGNDNINIELALKLNETIEKSDNENIKIEFFNEKKEKIILNKDSKKYCNSWDTKNEKSLKIKNNGTKFALIFLKIAVPKNQLVIINETTMDLPIEPEKLYAFYIPKESSEYKNSSDVDIINLYGVLISLKFEEIFEDFSFYGEISTVNYSSFWPKFTYKIFNYRYDKHIYSPINNGYYSSKDEEYYIYINYHGNKDKKIFADYNSMYEYNLKEQNYFEDEYDDWNSGIYVEFPLMIQIIKNNQNIKYDISLFSYTNKEGVKDLKCFNNDYNPLISYELNINEKFGEYDLFLFSFYKSHKSICLINEANDLFPNLFEPINDNLIKGELIEDEKSHFKYKFNFKPLEKSNLAEYFIYLFNSSNGNYSYSNLTNYYFLYTEIFEKYPYEKNFTLESYNGEFKVEDKEKFYLNIKDPDNIDYYIVIIAKQIKDYHSFKFYPAIKIKKYEEEERQEVILDNEFIEKTKIYNFTHKKHVKNSILITKNLIEEYSKGILMIQWINDSPSKYQNLLIYKGDNDNTTVIENINSNDLFFYNLNISEVDKTFLIYFSLNDEEKRNIKIYFTFIPSKGKNNFDNSEIQYKYLNNIQLPYFIDYREKKTFKNEILRLKYNENIIKDFYILSKFIDSNENIVLTKKIFQSNIKKFDNNYRFIQIEEENEISISKILIEFDINLKQGLSIKDNIEEFDIRRIESFIYNEINENEPLKIEANNVHKFYFFNLTSLIKEDGKSMIFYSPLLEKSKSKLYDNNFFKFYFIPNSSDTSINIFNKYSIDNNLYLQNRNITLISFISYNNEKKEEGFIDISLREKNKYEIITENEKKKNL